MRRPALQKRTLALLALMLPLAGLFVYVALTAGPLAPIAVTVTKVEKRSLSPALFGIGTVEARYRYRIGPTFAGRVKSLAVDVGDRVAGGQVIGAMDPVDLDERLAAMKAARKRAQAQLREAEVRHEHARNEERRYRQALRDRSVSAELAAAKQQEFRVAEAGLKAAGEELSRAEAELRAVAAQRADLDLVAPVNGLVVARRAEPGDTVVAGQTVLEMIDPASLWVAARFDQLTARGLRADLSAHIVLRSQGARGFSGKVLRIEPLADAVTEETLTRVIFDELPEPLPPIGELTEVTVALPDLAEGPAIPNAALRRIGGQPGVWLLEDGDLRFAEVAVGPGDLDGWVRIEEGLAGGEAIVLYSEKALNAHSRVKVVDRLPGVAP